jgi:hypothetical protein
MPRECNSEREVARGTRGHAATEYLLVIVLALMFFLARVDGRSIVALFLAALQAHEDSISFLLSLPVP